ncbi:LysR family transcriptional regulator [Metasolibacillus meyeri]|uniref:LysR family transcriptional regulator n=1 Tax=Metasolibacillus meyeri TaxID=1071052 RepID=A0AAW9NQK0_9BACL|nr:LysR family transcriptional regulator [Metasolibacillus meyeri]MEC1177056.1 LysR family transcriptional regulator [Metasolibacillus meyeri]
MRLDLYHVFFITAQEKSFSKAAEKLFITQPSVSHAIKQLEDKMEVQLFVRTSKGVTMTKEGKLLFEDLQQAFSIIHHVERKISEMKNLESGHVTIGGSDSTCKHYLLPYVQTFQDIYPNIQIRLQHGSTPQILDKLINGLIDIGIVHPPIRQNQVQLTEFLTIHSTFVVGKKYKELSNQILSLEELLSYPIISFSKTSSSRKYLEKLFEQQGLTVNPDIEVGSVELLIECAKIGMGIAFVTKELVLNELAQGELIEVNVHETLEKRTVAITTKKDMPLSIAAAQFLKHLTNGNI